MPDPILIATGGLFSGTGIASGSRGLISDPSSESVPTLVRSYVAAVLAGQSAAGDRVLKSMVRPTGVTPGEHVIIVYAGDEEAEENSQSHLVHKHTLELLVEIYGQGTDEETLLKQLEAIARVVVVLVLNDQDLRGCSDSVSYAGRQWGKDPDGRFVGEGLRLRFLVKYRTAYGELVPDEFLKLGLGIDTDGDGDVDPAKGSGHDIEDVISVRAT